MRCRRPCTWAPSAPISAGVRRTASMLDASIPPRSSTRNVALPLPCSTSTAHAPTFVRGVRRGCHALGYRRIADGGNLSFAFPNRTRHPHGSLSSTSSTCSHRFHLPSHTLPAIATASLLFGTRASTGFDVHDRPLTRRPARIACRRGWVPPWAGGQPPGWEGRGERRSHECALGDGMDRRFRVGGRRCVWRWREGEAVERRGRGEHSCLTVVQRLQPNQRLRNIFQQPEERAADRRACRCTVAGGVDEDGEPVACS